MSIYIFYFQKGVFTPIEDRINLREKMGTYYKFFSHSIESSSAVVTMPYIDILGLGKLWGNSLTLICFCEPIVSHILIEVNQKPNIILLVAWNSIRLA